MRTEYEMTQEDLDVILRASRPVRYMVIGGVPPRSTQAHANDAWRHLGNQMGFEFMTVKTVSGKGQRFFSAEATPTPDVLDQTGDME